MYATFNCVSLRSRGKTEQRDDAGCQQRAKRRWRQQNVKSKVLCQVCDFNSVWCFTLHSFLTCLPRCFCFVFCVCLYVYVCSNDNFNNTNSHRSQRCRINIYVSCFCTKSGVVFRWPGSYCTHRFPQNVWKFRKSDLAFSFFSRRVMLWSLYCIYLIFPLTFLESCVYFFFFWISHGSWIEW